MKIDVHDFPGKTYRLELPYRATVSQEELAGLACEAIELFCADFVTPLSVDLALGYCDAQWSFPTSDPGPEQAYWLLYTEHMPPQVEFTAAWIGAQAHKCELIDSDRLFDWICNAMAGARADNPALDDSVLIGWREILIRTVQVRLPDAMIEPNKDSLVLGVGTHELTYPVETREGRGYVNGPIKQKSVLPPLQLHVINEPGRLGIDINLYWSLWTKPGNPGYSHTQDALKRLQSALWLCTFGYSEDTEAHLEAGTYQRPNTDPGKPTDSN